MNPGESFTGRDGFTLLEILAALSITALLFLGVFEALSVYTTLTERVRQEIFEQHRRSVLRRLLWQDLRNQPVGDPNLSGSEKQIARTTVSLESERSLSLDTRVRYVVRPRKNREVLYREWIWSEIHTDTQSAQPLIEASRIRFSYRDSRSSWYESTLRADTVTAVRLQWNDRTIRVPYGP